MKSTTMDKRNIIFFWIVLAVVALGMLSRAFEISPNINPMLAVLLIGAAYFRDKKWAIIIPIGLYFLVDLYLNNVVYAEFFDGFQIFGLPSVYLSLALILGLGIVMLKKVSILSVLSSAIGAAVIFFLVTNFFSMLNMPEYTKDINGLMQSYTAGIPFFRSTLASTLVYSVVLFSAAELLLAQPVIQATPKSSTIKS